MRGGEWVCELSGWQREGGERMGGWVEWVGRKGVWPKVSRDRPNKSERVRMG